MKKGWANPKNAAPDTGGGGGFKEGLVQVDLSEYGVHQNKGAEGKEQPAPITALIWDVTRLDENMEPLHNPEGGEALTEKLVFSLGGKSISKVHPGKGSGPDDEEIEDQGAAVGTKGNTVYFVDPAFQVHPKSSLMVLMDSMIKCDSKLEATVDRGWAPDWKGCIFFMRQWVDDSMKQTYTDKEGKVVEKGTSYKVVGKVVRGPGAAKGSGKAVASAGGGPVAVEGNGKGSAEAEAIIAPILQKLSEECDGTQVSFKVFWRKISEKIQTAKPPISPKLQVPAIALTKDDNWLKKNGEKYDLTLDFESRVVTFGTPQAGE